MEAIIKNHYVDDLLYSNDSPEDTIRIAREIVQVHQEGGFEMRGFMSNNREVMSGLGENPETAESIKSIKADTERVDANEMVLGKVWDVKFDTFKFLLNFSKVDRDVMRGSKNPTRRQVISIMGSLYDPLGLVAHFCTPLALLSQELAQGALQWDDEISGHKLDEWKLWLSELPKNTPNFRGTPGKEE